MAISKLTFFVLLGVFSSSVARVAPRIIGGEPAQPGEFPYFAILGPVSNNFCAGALAEIGGKQFILTIARCCHENFDFEGGFMRPVSITVGHQKSGETSHLEQTIIANRGIWHPDFDFYNQHLCIMGLDGQFSYNEYVQPISLPSPAQGNTTGDTVVAGWGYLGYNNYTVPETLMKLTLPIMTREDCIEGFLETRFVPENYQSCIQDPNTVGTGTCVGDRGVPVKALDGNYLDGLIQVQPFSCEGRVYNLPDVYVQVQPFLEWIERTVGDL